MFRLVASLVVVLIVGLAWFLFGNRGADDNQSQQQGQSFQQPQPSADDDALRKSLGQ